MSATTLDTKFRELRQEIAELQSRHPKLLDDEAFLAWFIRAYLVGREEEAVAALTGGSNDKGLDAVVIEDHAKHVFLIQSKFRQKLLTVTETRADVLEFADLARVLLGDSATFADFTQDMDSLAADRLRQARDRCTKRAYEVTLCYVTTGKCSAALIQAAQQHVKKEPGHPTFSLFDGRRLINIFDDYLDGVAPPIPWVELPVDVTQGSSAGIVWRFDPIAQIESWVFVANGHDIGQLFYRAGVRIFARNVRGYLGLTDINRAITNTLASEPEHFLYFNNGVTVVCDDAEKVEAKGKSVLRIDNPQIINGQQTTRALAGELKAASKARVLVRVIRIPRNSGDADDGFEQLVSQIVEATNWQNQIKASDLMSNDRRQIAIERELRKRGYQYLRKRQTKREAHLAFGTKARLIVKKEELALAVAACELDPVVARSGKERLFEERYYKTVFPGEEASYYLIRYWLWKRVSFHARGSSERAYSRWVAIHFLWSEAGFDLRKNSRAFIKACESPRAPVHIAAIREFDRMIERSILAAIRFFRIEHGKHGNPVDVSGFFNRQGRHREFEKFWLSAENPHRSIFDNAADRFGSLLRELRD